MLSPDESAPIEGADPACEGIDEAVQLGIRKGSVHIAVSFRLQTLVSNLPLTS